MNRILEQVQSGDFDPKKMFTGNKDEFLEVKTAIESISNNLSKEVCIKFIIKKIIPTIFDKSVDNSVRDEAVEIGLHVLQFVNVSILNTKEQENVFTSIEETHAKVIGELRDSNYTNWDKLWIFLIKLCNEKLHTKMSLANKLLRVVEVAFRNSTSIEQRLKAYDCWIELINNSSLNMDHMCSAKQIKLLVTPMKAKFSRMPVVIMKRCDTFVYLLEKLGKRATLCLKEFLEFCFGPFDEKNDEKMKQGRSVPEVCKKSTTVLLEILGHSHSGSEMCLDSGDLQLYKPLVSDVNFPNFADILVKSVIECCILLNEWSQDLPTNNTIIKCLWQSLLQLVHKSSDDLKKKCCLQMNTLLKKLLERSQHNEYLHPVLGSIVNLLSQDEMVENFKEVIFDVSMHIIQHGGIDSFPFNVENIQDFVVSCFDVGNGSKFDKTASNVFQSNKKCESLVLCDIWLKCKITVVPDNITNLIWPIRFFQNFKDVEALKSKWSKLYISECKTENMKAVVMQELEKLFLENPLLGSNIVEFLGLIASEETNATKDFVARLMRLIQLILTLPNLSEGDIKKLSAIVLSYCNQNQHFYKSECNDEALDKLCGCLEHLVSNRKDYAVLTKLTAELANSQPKNLTKFAKRLMSFLEALMLNEDNAVANNTRKLIELLETKENEPDTVSLTGSRSQRMVNMANISKSKRLSEQVNLRLFGKDMDKPPPLSIKPRTYSSPRGKHRIVDNKKKDVSLLNDDKSSDYVKIDTVVKLNIDNLNEHQKEMLRKRREDIPALYQDLTQSQSQDFFSQVKDNISDVPENETLTNVEESSASSKKRKRDDSDDECVIKSRKIIEPVVESKTEKQPKNIETNYNDNQGEIAKEAIDEMEEPSKSAASYLQQADTETLEVEDIPEIFNDVETIPKIRTEDLNNMNIFEDEPPNFFQKVVPPTNKSEDDHHHIVAEDDTEKDLEKEDKIVPNVKESNVDDFEEKVDTDNEERVDTDNEEKVDTNNEEKVNTNNERVLSETENLNNDEKKNSVEKTGRRRGRHSARRFREEIIGVVRKQLEEFTEVEQNEADNAALNLNQGKDDTNINEDEKHANDEELKSVEIQGGVQETSIRKSTRQIKKRQSDFMVTYRRKKRTSTKENDNIISQSSQDDFVTKPDEVKVKPVDKKDRLLDDSPQRRKKKRRLQKPEEVEDKEDENYESIESLLARVDKRIEENKKSENKNKDSELKHETALFEDGNQNKITFSAKKFEEFEMSSVKEIKTRHSEPIRLTPPVFEELSPSSSPVDETFGTVSDEKPEGFEDVFEFKGDDEALPVEEIKKPKRRKKSMILSRSDYISKRRRRVKMDSKDEGFSFHVTADSPVPLSKSPSLRAVPSPEESETITIVITRTSPDSGNESKERPGNEVDTTPKKRTPSSPKKRSRRKTSLNSEDVIESSQVSPPVETSRRRSKSRTRLRQACIDEFASRESPIEKRRTRSSTLQADSEVTVPETETPEIEIKQEVTLEDKNEEVALFPKTLSIRRLSLSEPPSQKIKVAARHKRSQSLDKLDLENSKITFLSEEEPVHVNDTSVDTLTCESSTTDLPQETVITDSEEGILTDAEKIEVESISLSPVKSETNDDLPSSPITCDTPDRTIELLNSTSDISPINSVPEMSTPVPKQVGNEVSNMRVARLLQMANSKVQISDEGRRWFGNKHASPSSSRVRKMKFKKEENFDILTFSREVPSPLTVPTSGILKRKLGSLEETATPSPKRKRVNFSDPAITEKKIFIKDTEEYDIDQNTVSTTESQDQDDENTNKKKRGLLNDFNKEDVLLNFKEFCDSNFKDVHCSKIKDALKQLVQHLKVPDVVDVISEYFNTVDSEAIDEIKSIANESSQVVNQLIVPLIEKVVGFEEFLPRLFEVVEKLPDENLQLFITEFTKIFGERILVGSNEMTEKQIEDHVVNLDCDKMNSLIKKYFLNLEGEKRNDFLVELMRVASNELPVKKEFVNCHVDILQVFVRKMTD